MSLTLIRQVGFRHLRDRPLLAIATVLAIGVGVAVYLAVQLANDSANRAFRAGIDLVSGRSHAEVRGTDRHLAEASFVRIRDHPMVAAATPTLEADVILPEHPGRHLRLLGIDVFTRAPFVAAEAGAPDRLLDLEKFLAGPSTIRLPSGLMRELGLNAGEGLPVRRGGRPSEMRLLDPLPDAWDGVPYALIDIGWAQEWLDRPGLLSSVQVRFRDGVAVEEGVRALEEFLPPGTVVRTPRQRTRHVANMLRGFQLNLLALSLVSILVGVYLIYNVVSASVIRRRRETGILRSLGASRATVFGLFLGEALALGAVGTMLGMTIGVRLAGALVESISHAVSIHYLLIHVGETALAPRHFLLAGAYGLGAVACGAALPAWEAAVMNPVDTIRSDHRVPRPRPRAGRAVVATMLCGALALATSAVALRGGLPWASFGACLFTVLAFTAVLPAAAVCFHRLLVTASRWLPAWLEGMTVVLGDQFLRSFHRNGITIAAMVTALSMITGVSVMVHSFRGAVDGWLAGVLQGDVFIAPATEAEGMREELPGDLMASLESFPEVAAVRSYAERVVRRPGGDDLLMGILGGAEPASLQFTSGSPPDAFDRFRELPVVVINESMAVKRGWRPGDRVPLPTPSGTRLLAVAGVFRDYTRDQGILCMDRARYESIWGPAPPAQSVSFRWENEVPDDRRSSVLREIERRFGTALPLRVLSQAGVRRRAMGIFDQTFAVTRALKAISVGVAALGILLSLLTLVEERRRNIAALRAAGASRWQSGLLHVGEALWIGWQATWIGIGAGIALAVVLIRVVNRAFFGWSIPMDIPWMSLLPVAAGAILVAGLAGAWPAWRASRLPLHHSLRSL